MQTDDRIQPITRIIAVIVVPFLWMAFLILFFNPDSSGERFAWTIKPHMTAMYMGAGYLGGSWLFINAIFGKRWHRIASGFLPITTFTWFMMIATFLHWDKFSHGRLGFNLWLILYILTPFLIPILWNYNRKTDSGESEERDAAVPASILLIQKLVATILLIIVSISFINPEFMISIWPWTLSPLTARVLCGWGALLGVGAYSMSIEKRWSGWKTPLESIALWHVLVFVAALMNPSDFKTGLVNWYTIAIGVMLIGIFVFYLMNEKKMRKN